MAGASIEEVRTALDQGGARWTAEETPEWNLSLRQKQLRLGAVPPNTTMELREAQARKTALREDEIAADTPPQFDWRSQGGLDYVTAVKDQGGCGSCVAFGTSAAIETTARVAYGASLAIDISEAHLFYCVGRTQGVTCETGGGQTRRFRRSRVPASPTRRTTLTPRGTKPAR